LNSILSQICRCENSLGCSRREGEEEEEVCAVKTKRENISLSNCQLSSSFSTFQSDGATYASECALRVHVRRRENNFKLSFSFSSLSLGLSIKRKKERKKSVFLKQNLSLLDCTAHAPRGCLVSKALKIFFLVPTIGKEIFFSLFLSQFAFKCL
jgi:hypothetical protein